MYFNEDIYIILYIYIYKPWKELESYCASSSGFPTKSGNKSS